MKFNMQSHEDEDAPISAPSAMQDGPVDSQSELPYNQEQVMTTHAQTDEAGYQQLGFMTSRGEKWFTLSPDTLFECLIDSEMYLLRSAPTDEIDFDGVLSMAIFDIESEQTTSAPFHSKSLLEIVDEAVEEGVRQRSMIRRVITEMLACRHGVTRSVLDEAEKLLDDEIYERGISVFEQWKPASLPLKACVIAKDRILGSIKCTPREPGKEFHVDLRRIVHANCANIMKTDVFLSYDLPFCHFLSTLREETMLSCKPIPRSDENHGWTLDDGPWRYRLTPPNGPPGDWLDMNDEIQYKEVLHCLRLDEGVLTMMHEVEVDMVIRYRKEELKLREDWDKLDEDEGELVDIHGNTMVFDRGRALDFFLLHSLEPQGWEFDDNNAS